MLLLLSLGVVIGIVSGTLGIGGGILLVPALMWLAEIDDQRRAAGITLTVLALPVVLPAVWQYYASGLIQSRDLASAGWVAAGFALGGFAGAYAVPYLPVAALRIVFGLTLMLVGIRFLLASDKFADAAFYGLLYAAAAWVVYFALRIVGRRHLPSPSLQEHIAAYSQPPSEGMDYSI
jgi:uncharacterized membrane protein YfcA